MSIHLIDKEDDLARAGAMVGGWEYLAVQEEGEVKLILKVLS